MTYEEAIDFWYARVDFERRVPAPGDLKLDRIQLLLQRLGNPHNCFRILHLAGTKGKGSTSAMLAAALRSEGLSVGLFTSPHLSRVAERIQVDGEPISDAELVARIDEIRQAAQGPMPGDSVPLNERLTFFEIATALGLSHFACRRVAWAVLEVGLGGRFDSTNVCLPQVSIITSISFDHTQMLGDTLAKIAGEKAGIIKPGRPSVSGVLAPEAQHVIEATCRKVGSPLRQLGRDFSFEHEAARIGLDERPARVTVTTWRRRWPTLPLNLVGAHQAANASLALATLDLLMEQGVPLKDDAVARGLARVVWPARLEILQRKPLVVLDCAHNVASAQAMRDALLESFAVTGKRILIFAGSRDKDLAGMLAVLAPLFTHIILTHFDNPRCVPPERLRELLPAGLFMTSHLANGPADALAIARSIAKPDDLILATGSVFLAGEFRPLLPNVATI